MNIKIWKNSRKDVSDILTAAYHILPHEHSEAVAVVIPPERFFLDMLPYHIEAELLHFFNIKAHCFIAGWG